ncbi:hypothetical protein IAQ61_000315 [Plenodomus lingam]|uniref:uncharacterized protein n=1 Tax=Leptosphaeria maculans TaxID=5022 RepID=UPI00332E69F6|nr:hypothetical protein IAQ61_000315 [Plenodomus lingam]
MAGRRVTGTAQAWKLQGVKPRECPTPTAEAFPWPSHQYRSISPPHTSSFIVTRGHSCFCALASSHHQHGTASFGQASYLAASLPAVAHGYPFSSRQPWQATVEDWEDASASCSRGHGSRDELEMDEEHGTIPRPCDS